MPFSIPFIAGLSVAAKALLKTPAGEKALKEGGKKLLNFVKKHDDVLFAAGTVAGTAAMASRLEETQKSIEKQHAAGTLWQSEEQEGKKVDGAEKRRKGGFVKGKANRDGIAIRGKTVGGVY